MRLPVSLSKAVYVPSRSLRALGHKALYPFVLISLGAVWLLPHLSFTSDITNMLAPSDQLMRSSESFNGHFSEPSYVTVLYHAAPLFAPATLHRFASFETALSGLEDVKSVLSVTSVRDLEANGKEISFRSLYSSAAGEREPEARQLRSEIERTPLFRSFLVSKDGGSFVLYLFPKPGANKDHLAQEINETVGTFSGPGISITAVGSPILEHWMKRAGAHDLLFLGLISLLIAFILQSVVARSIRVGLALLLTSIVPTLWTIALFPLVGISMSIYSTVVPIVVMALSTSYGIHLFRRFSETGHQDMPKALNGVTPIVVAAGATTMLGFASISFVPIPLLRTLGLMAIPGILFSIVATLFLLPLVLEYVSRDTSIVERGRTHAFRMPEYVGTRAMLVLSVLGVVLAGFAAGIPRVVYDYRAGTSFRSASPLGARYATFGRENGGLQELIVGIDTGKEYGLVNPAVFGGVASLARSIEDFSSEVQVLSFTQLVDWVESRLATSSSSSTLTMNEIGEDLEMLFSSHSGLRVDSLVDPAYRRTRLIVYFGDNTETPRAATLRLERLERRIVSRARADLPKGTTVSLFGAAEIEKHQSEYLIRSEVYSGVFFFGVLIIVLLLVFRSIGWSLLVAIPLLAGLIFYFGVLGWSGSTFSPMTVFMVAVIMGVGNDDVLFFVLSFRAERRHAPVEEALRRTTAHTGQAIVQTTVVLAGALCALGLSQFTFVARESLIGAATLIVCTATTYVAVPALIRLRGRSTRATARRQFE